MAITYREGVPYDTCTGCGKEMEAWLLMYEPPEPHEDESPEHFRNPKCKWCLIKDAQEKFGVDNVHLGNEN